MGLSARRNARLGVTSASALLRVNDFDLREDAINAIDKRALPVEYGGKISSENKSEFLAAIEEKAAQIEENFRYLKKLHFLNESSPQDSVGFENEEEGSEI